MPLENEQDWQLFFRTSLTHAKLEIYKGGFEPTISPPLFDKPIIRIHATCPTAKKTWRLSGELSQEIGLGVEFGRWKIPLDRKIIVRVELSQKYRLRFAPTKWMLDPKYSENNVGEGTGVFELTLITRFNSSTSVVGFGTG